MRLLIVDYHLCRLQLQLQDVPRSRPRPIPTPDRYPDPDPDQDQDPDRYPYPYPDPTPIAVFLLPDRQTPITNHGEDQSPPVCTSLSCPAMILTMPATLATKPTTKLSMAQTQIKTLRTLQPTNRHPLMLAQLQPLKMPRLEHYLPPLTLTLNTRKTLLSLKELVPQAWVPHTTTLQLCQLQTLTSTALL